MVGVGASARDGRGAGRVSAGAHRRYLTSILGVSAFDSTLGFVQHPVFEALNVALITIVLYHTFNGVRVVLFDVGIGIRRQAGGFWACVALTALGTGASFVLSVPLIFV